MPARRLPDLGVRLRRGRRTDLDAIRALLGRPERPGAQRFDRRVVTDLGGDVYVAEAAGGALVGVVAVAYLRSLDAGRWIAVLDVVRGRDAALVGALVAFAEERARQRGCASLEARRLPDEAVRLALTARGWRAGPTALVTALEPAD